MFRMFAQLFSMITVLFSAGEKAARSLDNVASWADESTAAFNEAARAERKQKMAIHKAKMELIEGTAKTIAEQQLEDDRVHQAAIKAKELGNQA